MIRLIKSDFEILPTLEDDLCDDLGLGPECCLDLAGGVASLQRGESDLGWGKRCCDNIRGPVTVPRGDISDQTMMEVTT